LPGILISCNRPIYGKIHSNNASIAYSVGSQQATRDFYQLCCVPYSLSPRHDRDQSLSLLPKSAL
jgi:hypothetical protein